MTREEVMALSDEELRIKAAELAGWREGTVLGKPCRFHARHPYVTSDDKLPNYPHKIAAAWELLETSERAGWMWTIDTVFGSPKEYQVDLGCYADQSARSYREITIRDRTVPLAITRCFVLAMTQERT